MLANNPTNNTTDHKYEKPASMQITQSSIPDLLIAKSTSFKDHRGSLTRLFCLDALSAFTKLEPITQINFVRTLKVGSIRGFHFQYPPHSEQKMVRCLKGRVWDVAVDLRAGSSTFLQYHAQELSADDLTMLVIPKGFAHGFQTLEEDSEMLYLHTADYAPDAQGGVHPSDPLLGINWPLPIVNLSATDKSHALLTTDYKGISI